MHYSGDPLIEYGLATDHLLLFFFFAKTGLWQAHNVITNHACDTIFKRELTDFRIWSFRVST